MRPKQDDKRLSAHMETPRESSYFDSMFQTQGYFIWWLGCRGVRNRQEAEEIFMDALMHFQERYDSKVENDKHAYCVLFRLVKHYRFKFLLRKMDDDWLAEGGHGVAPSVLILNRKNKEWCLANPERRKEIAKKSRAACAEARTEWAKQNKDYFRKWHREYRKTDKYKQKQKAYYESNKHIFKERARLAYIRKKELLVSDTGEGVGCTLTSKSLQRSTQGIAVEGMEFVKRCGVAGGEIRHCRCVYSLSCTDNAPTNSCVPSQESLGEILTRINGNSSGGTVKTGTN